MAHHAKDLAIITEHGLIDWRGCKLPHCCCRGTCLAGNIGKGRG
jgi:hypothetical protein